MRRCDDIADDPALSARDRRMKLDAWVDAFHAAQAGLPTDDPVLLALTDAQRRFHIPLGLLDELAFGTAMDAEDEEIADPDCQSRLKFSTAIFRNSSATAITSPRLWAWFASAFSDIATPQPNRLPSAAAWRFS